MDQQPTFIPTYVSYDSNTPYSLRVYIYFWHYVLVLFKTHQNQSEKKEYTVCITGVR